MTMLYHPILKRSKAIPEGFSVTALLFGALVPLFRGDFKWFAISASVCVFGLFLFGIPTLFMWCWMGCCYNETYMLEQIKQGWVIASDDGSPAYIQGATR